MPINHQITIFLQGKKRKGLQGVLCSQLGAPQYVKQLQFYSENRKMRHIIQGGHHHLAGLPRKPQDEVDNHGDVCCVKTKKSPGNISIVPIFFLLLQSESRKKRKTSCFFKSGKFSKTENFPQRKIRKVSEII